MSESPSLKLFEVVRWGSDASPDGPNGEDTIFLVIANTHLEAAELIDMFELPNLPHERVKPYANWVSELGVYTGPATEVKRLRGPYYAFAYHFGSRAWRREKLKEPWIEEGRHQ
jgi:hypothetical protein